VVAGIKALALAATSLLLAGAGPAHAQAYQCRAPASVAVPAVERDGPVRQLPVTGYTLAASWSPEFCRTRKASRAHGRQCSGRAGTFGMVLHGLWPDGDRIWPQWCPARTRPTPRQIAGQLCASPSARLVARQWAKHGACMTRTPANYFAQANTLWAGIEWPDLDELSRREGLTAGKLKEMFVAANPQWRAAGIAVIADERGWLREMRLCYDRRFRPSPCGKGRMGASSDAPIRIWRGF
jgi:ribonuclease T2